MLSRTKSPTHSFWDFGTGNSAGTEYPNLKETNKNKQTTRTTTNEQTKKQKGRRGEVKMAGTEVSSEHQWAETPQS